MKKTSLKNKKPLLKAKVISRKRAGKRRVTKQRLKLKAAPSFLKSSPYKNLINQPPLSYVKLSISKDSKEISSSYQQKSKFSFPYGDNRLVVMAIDPWWLHVYWDISEEKIKEGLAAMSPEEKEGLKWILQVLDITEKESFCEESSFWEVEIKLDAYNWYIKVNKPARLWQIVMGVKNFKGKFFPFLKSNLARTPNFGIVSGEKTIFYEGFLKKYRIGISSL